jgi:hypothetical protein
MRNGYWVLLGAMAGLGTLAWIAVLIAAVVGT